MAKSSDKLSRAVMRQYRPDERRVCEYLLTLSGGQVGCGDDPIGFLIASHQAMREQRDDVAGDLATALEFLRVYRRLSPGLQPGWLREFMERFK